MRWHSLSRLWCFEDIWILWIVLDCCLPANCCQQIGINGNFWLKNAKKTPLSVHHQLFTGVHLKQTSSISTLISQYYFWKILIIVIASCEMATNGCSHWQEIHVSAQTPCHSFLFSPVGVSAVPEISALVPKVRLPRRQNPSRDDPFCKIRKCLVFTGWDRHILHKFEIQQSSLWRVFWWLFYYKTIQSDFIALTQVLWRKYIF